MNLIVRQGGWGHILYIFRLARANSIFLSVHLWNKKIVDSCVYIFRNPTRFTGVDYLFVTGSFLFWI